MGYNVGMNSGRKLPQALQTVSEISGKVMDLRVLLAKMSERQKGLFTFLIQGHNELETLVLAGRIEEIAKTLPEVSTNAGGTIKTNSLKTTSALRKLSTDGYDRLLKLASDYVKVLVGDFDYKHAQDDISFALRFLASDAVLVVNDIMTDKKVSPQTRLTAANSVLDRAGYRPREPVREAELPVKLIIQMPVLKPPELGVVDGIATEVNPTPEHFG